GTGLASACHLVPLGSRAAAGVALVMVEPTAVTREGRISPGDMGIWSDDHIAPLARIARFVSSQGAVPGLQLAHAGRKGSCEPPWKGGAVLRGPGSGGWPIVAPSPIPFREGDPVPTPLDEAGLDRGLAPLPAAPPPPPRGGGRPPPRAGGGGGPRGPPPPLGAGPPPRPGGGLPRPGGPRGPRLPAARVPLAFEQPPHRPVRRQPGEPDAAAAQGQ